MAEKTNGVYVEVAGDGEEEKPKDSYFKAQRSFQEGTEGGITLYTIFNRLIAAVLASDSPDPLFQRTKIAVAQNIPLLRSASKNTAHNVLLWTRHGSPLRALLVVSVGTIALLALTGFMVFMIFFAAATINAIVISLLVSLAAAGGFLALFFAFLTAIYIGALSVALFVISVTTISAIIAALVTTGMPLSYSHPNSHICMLLLLCFAFEFMISFMSLIS
ncbi:OLC1v1010291C1 [Oldenlandia corymbosa var. corymbosa]|uniref:OLC1v1010291C1 n=1 Tax=Oldenlandia corymbosa var. corymbosa TaxID=529605 RepID=A0AAV1DR22_OLDCO|nr:OLC1v1010291C1 [Oldenlandia corymbosa var. corymbosa]